VGIFFLENKFMNMAGFDDNSAPCPLDSAKCKEICEAMLRLMQNSMQRRAVAAAENTVDEDADDQAHVEFQSLLYTEEQLLYMLAEIIGMHVFCGACRSTCHCFVGVRFIGRSELKFQWHNS
jgi:hypothetical protein